MYLSIPMYVLMRCVYLSYVSSILTHIHHTSHLTLITGCEHSVAIADDGVMYSWGHGDGETYLFFCLFKFYYFYLFFPIDLFLFYHFFLLTIVYGT